jgi:hypothetical protein
MIMVCMSGKGSLSTPCHPTIILHYHAIPYPPLPLSSTTLILHYHAIPLKLSSILPSSFCHPPHPCHLPVIPNAGFTYLSRYLPGVSPAQPGLKIAFANADLLHQFPDAAAPYLHFGCSLAEHFPGTLFRFPLRSDITAGLSEIKPSMTSVGQISDLFQTFRSQLPDALLFLKNVRRVSVWQLDGAASEPRMLFEASSSQQDGGGRQVAKSLQVCFRSFVQWCAVVCSGVQWCAVVCSGVQWCAVV